MTDAERVASKLALIETRLTELRTLARPSLIAEDVFQERFVEYTLQTAVQAGKRARPEAERARPT